MVILSNTCALEFQSKINTIWILVLLLYLEVKTAYSVGFVWLGLNIIYYVHVCQEVLYSDMYSMYTNNCVLAVNITSVGKFRPYLSLKR